MAEVIELARRKRTDPSIQRQTGQISLEEDDFLVRFVDQWRRPNWVDATTWRNLVMYQPVAVDCREAIISSTLSLDWKIDSRDSEQRDELKGEIQEYTDLFEFSGEVDYLGITEWLLQDYLDIPFGAGAELGREGNDRDGKVHWIIPLDGATLFPYPNYDWPVGQTLPYNQTEKVYFPRYNINRMYMSPRREIDRHGWGCAPPEKIYLALEMLNRGDRYYASLLLDTPEAGILDLGDVSKTSAKEWIKGWRRMLGGIDPFKIPILYEHEKPASWISFTRSPTEVMFDKAILKYAALVTAGYGLSLSDINVPTVSSGGDTLAGTIRGERKSRRNGMGRVKKAMQYFWNRVLPSYLMYSFIDLDDEVSVALSRARLANATAIDILVKSKVFTQGELRRQTLADGLISISVPEEVPEGEFIETADEANNKQTGLMGRPVAPSQGGYGEVKSETMEKLVSLAYNRDPVFKDAFEQVKKSWNLLDEYEKKQSSDMLQQILNGFASSPEFLDELAEIDDNLTYKLWRNE